MSITDAREVFMWKTAHMIYIMWAGFIFTAVSNNRWMVDNDPSSFNTEAIISHKDKTKDSIN